MVEHRLLQPFGMHGAAPGIDVHPVRLVADHPDGRAQLAQDFRRDLVGGAVGAIDDDPQPLKIQIPGQGAFHELDVPPLGVVDSKGLAHVVRRWTQVFDFIRDDQRLHSRLELVGELEPVIRKELDAVVLIGIVRG